MSSAIAPLMNKLVAEATTRSDPTVGDLIEEITDLLGRSVIQEHAEACQILRTRLTHLSGESDSDQLTVQQQRFYNICPYLINRQGGYNSACLKLLKTIKKNTKVSVPKIAFGKAEWKKYFGDVGAEPPLPANLNKILYSPCPFWPGRKVLETHLLTLIPSHINKENLAIKYLREHYNKRTNRDPIIITKLINEEKLVQAPQSYWILMTKDIIPNSRNKTYNGQCAMLSHYSGYDVPQLHEAAISILAEYTRNGICLFGENPWTVTRCQQILSIGYPSAVGNFSESDGNIFYFYLYDHEDGTRPAVNIGLAAVRRLT